MKDEISRRQQEMLDREEINRVLLRYCRAINRLDVDLLKSVFHPDATSQDLGEPCNAHDWADRVIPVLSTLFAATLHSFTNLDMVVDGDRAVSESHYTAFHRVVADRKTVAQLFGEDYAASTVADGDGQSSHDYVSRGRYLHRWERLQGEWRVQERVETIEFGQFGPATCGGQGSIIGAMPSLARRDRTDPVYALLASVGSGA